MGIGHLVNDVELPGVLTERICEQNARGFYSGWVKMMDAK
jgi:hypothetical protein